MTAPTGQGWEARFRLRVLVPGALILMVTAVMCAAAVIAAGRGADSVSLAAQRVEAWRAINEELDALALAQESIGLCDACIEHASSSTVDRTWLDANVGFRLFDLANAQQTYILDPAGRPLYASVDRHPANPTEFSHVASSLTSLIALASGHGRRPTGRSNLNERLPGLPPQPLVIPSQPGFTDTETTIYPSVRTSPDVVHATDLVRVGPRLAAVSVMRMRRSAAGSRPALSQPALLVNLRYLDEDVVLKLGERNYLPEARLAAGPALRRGEVAEPVLDSNGKPLGYILWKPALVGSVVIDALVLPAMAAFLVIAVLILFLALRMRGLMRRDALHLATLRRSGERLRLIQDASRLADFESNAEGLSVCSDLFFAQVGLPIGDGTIDFETWLEMVHPDDRDRLIAEVAAALASEDEFGCEFRVVHAGTGETRWIASRTKVVRDAKGDVVSTIGAHLDVTESKLAEVALVASEERFRLAAEAAGLGIWDYDPASGRRQWSERLTSILGLPPDSPPDLALATQCVRPSHREALRHDLHELLHGQRCGKFESSYSIRRLADAEDRWVTMNGWKVLDEAGHLSRLIVTVRDSTDEKAAAEQARWSANHDPLTGLANRRLFQTRLEEGLNRASTEGQCLRVLLFDLDHFKQINDTLGHDAGDMLLKMFANRLKTIIRDGDTIARCGGDEFALILPFHHESDIADLCRLLAERLREPFVHDGRLLDCRASIGTSSFPNDGATPDELLKNADIALYSAKAAGRGRMMRFEPRLRADLHRRNKMIQLGREAVRHNRIIPYYQPKIDLSDGRVTGFEALLRWRAPSGRIHHPHTIQAAFDDLEVAAEISERMVEQTIADIRSWLDRGIPFGHVALNAAAAEFRQDNFAERLLGHLARARVATCYFQLEVTETVFLGRGAEFVHRALSLLSAEGVKIALDDFGTGYASLRHLKEFPVDIIKIDQSFVRDMQADPSDAEIIRAVVNLGRNLGIRVVAEGIETSSQCARLRAFGCHYGQGFLFSKGVPARRVPTLASTLQAKASAAGAGGLRLIAG